MRYRHEPFSNGTNLKIKDVNNIDICNIIERSVAKM